MTQEEERQEDGAERRRRIRWRLWQALALVVLLLAVLLVPPMISISHYKGRITQMVSQALGRPVRLSAVELRLLPRPGFVITDLTVEEDPAYGAEPVLHANSVTASVGFFALWRGKLEISRISVDEASLNLVRTPDGRWNLDPIFRSATGHADAGSLGARHPLPYLEATNSRVNVKNGLEKLPFSLMDADLSFWQADHDTWRLRLRGQPARTDVHLAQADTGIVRLEATLRRAPQLRQMPVHVDMEWKEAQMGQLSRLLIGSDPGWRGDLTGQMQLDGTAGAAQVKARLKATGVHRAEFAPAETPDFDANCSFVLHYSARSIESLACDSPLGAGHVRLTGDLPAQGPVRLAVDVQRVPVSAGLATLRTLRSGIPDDLEARGSVSGQLTYDPGAVQKAAAEAASVSGHASRKAAAKARTALPEALQGSLAIDGFELRGGGLSQPIQVAKVLLAPAATGDGQPQTLAASVALPEGGEAPLQLSVRLQASGYQVGVRGPAAWPRLRELAHLADASNAVGLDEITSDTAVVDLNAQGPWLPSPNVPVNSIERAGSSAAESGLLLASAGTDVLDGTVTLRNASWKSADLANPVQMADATLHLNGGTLLWNPVDFTYGPVKGTASLQVAADCPAGEECPPHLDLRFDRLDTAALQAALLGARKPGTVLSTLLARFTRRTDPAWPRLNGTLWANALVLGPVILQKASVGFSVLPASAKFSSVEATLLGGQLHASGTLAGGDKPSYSFEGGFEKVSAAGLCQVLKLRCSGGPVQGNGKLALAGFSSADLAASAAGTLHFEWRRGTISGTAVPKPLARFTRWTGDAEIGHESLMVKQNQVLHGGKTAQVDASVELANPPKIVFPAPKPAETAHR